MTYLFLFAAVWITYNLGKTEADANVEAIMAALRERCSDCTEVGHWGIIVEDAWETAPEWAITRAQDAERWFYAAKAVICILLGKSDWLEHAASIEAGGWDCHRSGEEGYSWKVIRVGKGVFRNWYYWRDQDYS